MARYSARSFYFYWLGILHDVSYVHGQNIIHDDIKSNNAVVEKQGENYSAVLIDFGKATAVNDGKIYPEFDDAEKKKYQRKFPYLAPELKIGAGWKSEGAGNPALEIRSAGAGWKSEGAGNPALEIRSSLGAGNPKPVMFTHLGT